MKDVNAAADRVERACADAHRRAITKAAARLTNITALAVRIIYPDGRTSTGAAAAGAREVEGLRGKPAALPPGEGPADSATT